MERAFEVLQTVFVLGQQRTVEQLGLHRKLGIDIPESDYAKLITPTDLVSYLKAEVDRRGDRDG